MPGPGTLPLFPLSSVVLFPGVQTPLHIFEPRYRQMTEHALAGSRRIGMVAVRPEAVEAMAGNPPVFGVGCEGRITDAKRLPDGRFNILLLGTQRFRILRESPPVAERLYRVAEIERLEDPFDSASRPRVLALRHRAIELVGEIARDRARRPTAHAGAVSRGRRRHLRECALERVRAVDQREAGPARGRFDPRSL